MLMLVALPLLPCGFQGVSQSPMHVSHCPPLLQGS
jgi:hypothetical protein